MKSPSATGGTVPVLCTHVVVIHQLLCISDPTSIHDQWPLQHLTSTLLGHDWRQLLKWPVLENLSYIGQYLNIRC